MATSIGALTSPPDSFACIFIATNFVSVHPPQRIHQNNRESFKCFNTECWCLRGSHRSPGERPPPPFFGDFLWLPPMIFFITIVQSIFLIRVRCAYSGLTRSQQSHVEALPGNDIDSPGLQGKGASQVIAGTWFLGTSFSESEDLFV